MTPGITFHAWKDERDRTTADVLDALGDRVERLRWRVHILDATSDEPALFDTHTERATAALLELLGGVQIIDGDLQGRRPGDEEPYVIVRAVDGSWWDVESEDAGLLDAARAKFPDAFDVPT